jgi:hypothetical protein
MMNVILMVIITSVEQLVEWELARETEIFAEPPPPSTILYSKNPTRRDLGLNPDRSQGSAGE